MSKVRHHNYLSVNSHEIRRRINGLQERMIFSNYPKYADRLDVLCSALISDPICEKHYETDVQWNVLCFLLEVAQRPETGLAKLSSTKLLRIAAPAAAPAPLPAVLSIESPKFQITLDQDTDTESELSVSRFENMFTTLIASSSSKYLFRIGLVLTMTTTTNRCCIANRWLIQKLCQAC